MNKIAGHTLGTPGMSVPQALHLFHEADLDAAEIIWQDEYEAGIPENATQAQITEIQQTAENLGLEIAGLTPYMSGFNSLVKEERQRDQQRMQACIRVAQQLNCSRIRVYAGSYKPGDPERTEKWKYLVESLQLLGEQANSSGVVLCVENHFNTMTVTAEETAELMQLVDSPGVGILYDQANLAFTYSETYEQAIELQQEWIRHVHVKDLIFVDPHKPFKADAVERVKAEDRAIRSRVVGTGVLDWPEILMNLQQIGYKGFLSLEYEYRWHPQDLPEPGLGFRQGAKYLRQILASIQAD